MARSGPRRPRRGLLPRRSTGGRPPIVGTALTATPGVRPGHDRLGDCPAAAGRNVRRHAAPGDAGPRVHALRCRTPARTSARSSSTALGTVRGCSGPFGPVGLPAGLRPSPESAADRGPDDHRSRRGRRGGPHRAHVTSGRTATRAAAICAQVSHRPVVHVRARARRRLDDRGSETATAAGRVAQLGVDAADRRRQRGLAGPDSQRRPALHRRERHRAESATRSPRRPGTWSNQPTAYTYQWERCSADACTRDQRRDSPDVCPGGRGRRGHACRLVAGASTRAMAYGASASPYPSYPTSSVLGVSSSPPSNPSPTTVVPVTSLHSSSGAVGRLTATMRWTFRYAAELHADRGPLRRGAGAGRDDRDPLRAARDVPFAVRRIKVRELKRCRARSERTLPGAPRGQPGARVPWPQPRRRQPGDGHDQPCARHRQVLPIRDPSSPGAIGEHQLRRPRLDRALAGTAPGSDAAGQAALRSRSPRRVSSTSLIWRRTGWRFTGRGVAERTSEQPDRASQQADDQTTHCDADQKRNHLLLIRAEPASGCLSPFSRPLMPQSYE